MNEQPNSKTVTAEIEVSTAGSGKPLHVERFTYTPVKWFRDANTRLFSAKLAYRQSILARIADRNDPLHQKLHGHQLRFGGKLIE